ncbi:MAG: hypothetical protein AB7F59_03150 [Bdellovibrionales bacterium]
MKQFISALLLICSSFSNAYAVPHQNKLIQPDSVKVVDKTKLKVTYTLPCIIGDAVGIVMTNDDSGDQVVAVGVVYSAQERNCRKGPNKTYSQTVDPSDYGYTFPSEEFSELAFEPMPVE